MEVEINTVKISGDELEAVITLKENFRYQNFNNMDVARGVAEKVIRAATDEYLRKHLHEIMANIDQQQILNMIVINSAGKISK